MKEDRGGRELKRGRGLMRGGEGGEGVEERGLKRGNGVEKGEV